MNKMYDTVPVDDRDYGKASVTMKKYLGTPEQAAIARLESDVKNLYCCVYVMLICIAVMFIIVLVTIVS